jgi:hypothetical protein
VLAPQVVMPPWLVVPVALHRMAQAVQAAV